MNILENRTTGKYGTDDRNEDAVVVTPDFAAVIDGATDISAALIDGVTPGRFAAQIAAAAFTKLDKNADAAETVTFLTAALADARQAHHVPPEMRPFCVFACYSKTRRQIFRLKDIKISVNGAEIAGEIAVVEALTEARRALLHTHLAGGKTVAELLADDPSRAVYAAFSEHNFALLNNADSTYGFGAIDGSPVPEVFVETIDVPPEGAEIILASDGYPALKNSLAESEAALAEILAHDPLLIGDYPQPRAMLQNGISFDDRSYLRFSI